MKPYPFSAIVGHDRLRLALLLCAVRPEIGGALIRGEKGTAKSTAVRGLAALLSVATGSTETGLVELPLGATEDRVVGSLDLQRVMRDGEHAFSPGLLARAHGGVLYVDEVNLLHDHLVDILLDAAAMGRVHVERDGISHSHEARFVLIGTMNPEEGELRPQLLDRFGLTVDVQASRDIDVRVQVIRRRMAYEADPDAFVARYADADAELAHRIAAARATVDDVVLGDNELRRIAALCAAFDVDGMRADLVVARTAAAHAAWRGVRTVEEQDIRAAAELALPHRRRRDPFDDHGIDRDQLDEALALASVDPEPEPDPPGGGQSANEPASQPNSTGLIGALRQAGHTVAPFKVGPDFIDPGYHALAAGRPGRNLDPVLVGERLIGPLYAHGVAGADIAVIEGVLGLFDGRIGPAGGAPAAGSTAHVAALLGAPVILVVDARGQSHSVAALLHGFSTFDTATRIAGVILNRVGSARHEQVLRQACDQAGVAVLGAIPRTAELELPTRYLGLVTAVEYGRRARLAVQAMTAVVARHVDLAAVIACAGSQAAHPPWDPVIAVGNTARQPATVAIAAGRAFTFGYAEHAEMLRAAGAEVVEFDPLSETLPEGTDAVVLPGGFPEQFTAELSANDTVRRQINELAAAGAPVHAECAGLLYLVSELDGHPMCGVVAGSARFTQHLKLGYRDAVAVVDSALYSVGERVVGHEFHRTAVTFADSYQPAWVYQGQDVDDVRDGAVHSGVHASYLHTHPAATPGAVARFVAHAACNTPRA